MYLWHQLQTLWTQHLWVQNVTILIICAAVILLIRNALLNERTQRATRRFRHDKLGILCGCIVVLYLLIGVLDCLQVAQGRTVLDWLFQHVADESSYSAPFASTTYDPRKPLPLNSFHLFGTDLLGKDVLLQTLKGCRTALLIGGMTTAIYIPVGTLLGIIAGYYRRWADDIIQYIYSTLASIPSILLLIAVIMTLGKGLGSMALALSLTAWIGLCRLVRGETLRQATRPYVEAARSLGQSNFRIITSHLLPNVLHLVIINAVLGFSGLVMVEAILSYLGVGAPVGTASWGAMIDGARMELSRDPVVWWTVTAASGALFILVLSLNILGDSLRKAFDPKGT